jgi:hypothetical protein
VSVSVRKFIVDIFSYLTDTFIVDIFYTVQIRSLVVLQHLIVVSTSSKNRYKNIVWCIDGLPKQMKVLGLECKVELYILDMDRSCKNLGLKVCGKFW